MLSLSKYYCSCAQDYLSHDRNRAALRLSDSLEKARGFHGTGMLEYQLQARKLLQTLGRDVSNLKRDLQDQEYKRKKEIGYPVTPIADRRKKATRGKENGAMAFHEKRSRDMV